MSQSQLDNMKGDKQCISSCSWTANELLAALSGASGDIITVQKGLDPYDLQLEVFAVSPTISFVSSSERVAINRLVKTGYRINSKHKTGYIVVLVLY